MKTSSAVAVLRFVHYIAQAKNAAFVSMYTVTKAGLFYKHQRYLQRSPLILLANFYSKTTRLPTFYTTAPCRFYSLWVVMLSALLTKLMHVLTYLSSYARLNFRKISPYIKTALYE